MQFLNIPFSPSPAACSFSGCIGFLREWAREDVPCWWMINTFYTTASSHATQSHIKTPSPHTHTFVPSHRPGHSCFMESTMSIAHCLVSCPWTATGRYVRYSCCFAIGNFARKRSFGFCVYLKAEDRGHLYSSLLTTLIFEFFEPICTLQLL